MKAAYGAAWAVGMAITGHAHGAELIANGGFEDGVYASTIAGNTNKRVPVGWGPNAAFDLEPKFNFVAPFNELNGDFSLSIGNSDSEPTATLSQTFLDVPLESYNLTFFAYDSGAYDDADAFLKVTVGGQTVTFTDNASSYQPGYINFFGFAKDKLLISAQTDVGEWYVDDISVLGPALAAAAIEPATWALMITGFCMIGFVLRNSPAIRK